MDVNMRPCSIDVVNKDQTKDFVKGLIKNNSISNVSFVNKIDNSKKKEYVIDRIL